MKTLSSSLDGLNLNHLRALNALLSSRSVTRAAETLGVTQSAVSHALRGLRDALGDALLVRGSTGMILTARAEALKAPLSRALRDLEQALDREAMVFDPASSQRTFTLAMVDAFTITVLPEVLGIVRREAPGVDLDVRPSSRVGYTDQALERGEMDLALVAALPDVPGIRSRHLAPDGFACAVRKDHPEVGDVLDLETYCRLPHALMSPRGEGLGIVDQALAELGRRRRVHLRIRYFLAAPLVVATSDLIVTGSRRLLTRLAKHAPLRILEPPLELPSFRTHVIWHDRVQDDPGHRWLRNVLVRAMKEPP